MPALFDRIPIGVYRTSPSGELLRANAALTRLLGFDSAAALLAQAAPWFETLYAVPGRRAQFLHQLHTQGRVLDFVSELRLAHVQRTVWVREAAYAVQDEQGRLAYYEGTMEDITASHLAHHNLARDEERWKLALETSGDGVWEYHVPSGDVFYSRRCKEIYGFAEHEILPEGDALERLTHPDDVAQMLATFQAHLHGETPAYHSEHRILCKDGSWKWVLSRGMVIGRDAAGTPLRVVGTHTDITERKQAHDTIAHQAHYDTLTGLPNRRLLRQELETAAQQCEQSQAQMAIVFMDLDHFKEVNDTLGHASGDELLLQVAQRLQQVLGEDHVVARMGGDEFTLVLRTTGPALEALLYAVLQQIEAPFALGLERVYISASLGVAIYPLHGTQPEQLFRHADLALYAAKGLGRNRFHVFENNLQDQASTRARLLAGLRGALAGQQLEVVYQPIVDLRTQRVRRAEALLRWHHPEWGSISPAQFIPLAEASGLIVEIGDWVFQQAVQQAMRWRRLYGEDFRIGVNKSPVQFQRQRQEVDPWVQHLNAMGVPGSAMAIEITEGLLLDTGQDVLQHLADLRASGIAIALDDFGTGYSSLTYLKQLELDVVKIDRSFVHSLTPGSTDAILCKLIIDMAHAMRMTVVAEGVETEAQYHFLREAGCDYAQGYLFARPLQVPAFEAFMAAQPT